MKRRLILISCLVALTTTACGKSSPGSGLAQLNQVGFVSQAASASVAQKTAKMTMLVTVTPQSGSALTINADGVMDLARKVIQIKMNVPAGNGSSMSLDMIMSKGIGYMQFPAALRAQMGLSKPWIGIRQINGGKSGLGLSNVSDPSALFDALRSVASSVTRGATVKVRGVDTTEYAVTLDMAKLAAKLPAAQRAAVSALNFSHLNVFVSSDNLIRREEFSAGVQGASVTTTIDLFDYGVPVKISVPPASQVEFKNLSDLIPGQ